MWPLGFLLHIWSAGALYYCSFPSCTCLRLFTAAFYCLVVIFYIALSRRKRLALISSLFAFLAVALWFSFIKPPVNAVYPPELEMAQVDLDGDLVTIRGVRNCNYRAKDDFDVRYETRTYDIKDLNTLDVMVNYWGMNAVAHTFLSFGFSNGEYLAVSIEIRPQAGRSYGMFKGLFKQYELIYIWADEKDIVRLRTNFKDEDVYLYRVSWPSEIIRKLFISMLKRTEALYLTPDFYNTLTHSCTNTIVDDAVRADIAYIPWYRRHILTGNIDRHMYVLKDIRTYGESFEELRRESLINDRAKAADKDMDFSVRIRTHLK